jgi:hypothetical protein
MQAAKDKSPSELIDDTERVTRSIRKGIREALRRHKLLGQSVVVWENGAVRWVPPEEIPDFEDE